MPPFRKRSAASSAVDAVLAGGEPKADGVVAGLPEAVETVPVPLAVIARYLDETQTPREGSSPSSPLPPLRVEVETKQGYVYTGHLTTVDAYYNFTLESALVHRMRVCDVEREAIRNKFLGTIDREDLPVEMLERPDSATSKRFVGSVVVRSNNVYLVRFLNSKRSREDPLTPPPQGAAASTRPPLESAFQKMAIDVKKALEKRRRTDREQRRQRLAHTKQ